MIEMVMGFIGALMCIGTFTAGMLLGMKLRAETVKVEAVKAETVSDAEADKKKQKQAEEEQEAWEKMMGYDISQVYRSRSQGSDAA